MMDYTRLPELEGTPNYRVEYATVRGDLRRHDADISSFDPYFQGAVTVLGGYSIQVEIDGAAFNVPEFTSAVLTTVLSDINTVLGAAGTAFELDGCLAIRTATKGASGTVRVVGGNAATALGFYLNTNTYFSSGGDINSTAEGRVGQPFGTAFMNPGERLTSEAVRRGMVRISENADVLFANQSKPVVSFEKIGQISLASNVQNAGPYALPATTRIFSKFGKTKFYVTLVEASSQKPHRSAVTAIRNGVTPADGVDQTIKASQQITAIKSGRFVEVADTAGVSVGDYATISGATNLSLSNNNGAKWVVASVPSAGVMELRPMSKAEAELYAVVDDSQPVVRLNDTKAGAEQYGSVTIHSGPFAVATHITTDSPLLPGDIVDVYAAVPARVDSSAADVAHQSSFIAALDRHGFSGISSAHTAIVSNSSGSVTSEVLTYGSFYVIWDGRLQRIPGGQVTISGAYVGIQVYASWNPATGYVDVNSSYSYLPLLHISAARVVAPTALLGATVWDKTIKVGSGLHVADLNTAMLVHSGNYSYGRIELYGGSHTAPAGGWTTSNPLEIVGIGRATLADPNGAPILNRTGGAGQVFPSGTKIILTNVNAASDAELPFLVSPSNLSAVLNNVGGAGSSNDRTLIRKGDKSLSTGATTITLDAAIGNTVVIGPTADGVELGKTNAMTTVKGDLTVEEFATVGTGVNNYSKLGSGAAEPAGGYLELGRNVETPARLTKTKLDTLITGVNADTLHSHAHGNLAGGTLHAAADGTTAGFLSAATQDIGGLKTFKDTVRIEPTTGDATLNLIAATQVCKIASIGISELQIASGDSLTLSTANQQPLDLNSAGPLNLSSGTGIGSYHDVTISALQSGDISLKLGTTEVLKADATTGLLDFKAKRATNLADPTAAQDAVTLQYAEDNFVQVAPTITWTDIGLVGSGYTANSPGPQYCKIGPIVYLRGSMTATSGMNSTEALPAACWPVGSTVETRGSHLNGSSWSVCGVSIHTDGHIQPYGMVGFAITNGIKIYLDGISFLAG